MMTKPQYKTLPFSLERKQIVDFLKIGKKKHTAYVFLELDITGIRDELRRAGRKYKRPVSLTGYLLSCYVRAVAEDKRIQASRKGNKLVIFDDVDVSTMVERSVDGVPVPISYIVRKANTKSVYEISEEIVNAKKAESSGLIESEEMRRKKFLYSVVRKTGFLRRWFLKRMSKDPFLKKKINGTIGFSSMGMFSYNNAGWILPITPHVISAMVGGIRKLPGIENGELIEKEMVCVTISIDHDTLDGAPTARFIERFRKLLRKGIECSEGIESDLEKSDFSPKAESHLHNSRDEVSL